MQTKRIPLVGSLTNRGYDSSTTKDQFFTNCYPEVVKNSVTGSGSVFLHKRVGSSVSTGPAVQSFPPSCIWSGNSAYAKPGVFAFSGGGTGVEVWSTAPAQIGADIVTTGTGNCYSLTETSINGVGNLVAIVSDAGVLETWFFPQGGAWTQLTDGDWPPNLGTPEPMVGEPAFLNNRMFQMTLNGKIWNTDINSLSAVTASAYSTAQSYPDGGCGIARYKDYIVAFGMRSIEFFQDAGLTPSPLQSIGNAVHRIGAVQPGSSSFPGVGVRTILPVTDTVYFFGISADTGRVGVYRLNGFQPEEVSNAAVSRLLEMQILGFAGAFTMHGMTHVMLQAINLDKYNLCYCQETGQWWRFYMDGINVPVLGIVGGISIGDDVQFVANNTAGLIYRTGRAEFATFQDNSQAYTQTVQIGPLDMGTDKRKFYTELRIIGDTQSATSNVDVSWSDDDGVTFSTARSIDMSQRVKRTTRLGASIGSRIWKLTHAANTANRMQAVEIDYTVGTS